ncbi:MAG: ABC transporter ATP-binding protein [Patescibacteria group bacterium]|jgi:ABC-type branched-subunit amino acid transport system ATPase component
MLKLTHVKKYFGGVKAVNDCSFEIKPGKITALIGPNGAGKSTIFNLISGLDKIDSGKIEFNGQPIAGLSPEQISNLGMSRLFQQPRLFNNLTVLENVLLAVDNEDTKFWKNFLSPATTDNKKIQQAEAVLDDVGIKEKKDQFASDLSFGQKRLVELARVLLNPHVLLMLDEPVAGVNPKLRSQITEVLTRLAAQGDTILLIEHDMNFTLKISDRVIVMDEGKVLADGTPEEIRNDPKVLSAYLGE